MAESQGVWRSTGFRIFLAVILITLLLIANAYRMALAYNENDSSELHHDGERPLRSAPECPQVWDSVPMQHDSVYRVPAAGLAVPGATTNVPEFHDCQRFLALSTNASVPGQFAYDSLFAVFANPNLGVIDDSIRLLLSTGVANRAIAAAQVYTLGPGYAPLGIGADFSCLYLYAGPLDSIRAVMVNVGQKEQLCATRMNPDNLAGKRLKVIRTSVPEPSPREFPTAARWDWSSEGNQQYIGVRCGDAWCEIGDSTFAPSPRYARGGIDQDADRVINIKGWYDEQYLAEIQPQLRPGPVKATIIPHPHLKSARFTSPGWDTVAYVALDGPSAYYANKFGFLPAPVSPDLGRLNRIEICYGTRVECLGSHPASSSIHCGWLDTWWSWLPDFPQKLWWAKYTSAGAGATTFKCVTRRTHENLPMGSPGTARWRFLHDDETAWVECRQGCCETAVN